MSITSERWRNEDKYVETNMNVLPWTSVPLSTAAAGTLDPCYSDCDKFGGVTGGWYGSEDDPITLTKRKIIIIE